MKSLVADLWEKKSLPPGWLGRLTPHEFATLFLRPADAENETSLSDATAMLATANQERGREKLKPLIPPALLTRLDPRRPADAGPGSAAAAPPAGTGFANLMDGIVPAGVVRSVGR